MREVLGRPWQGNFPGKGAGLFQKARRTKEQAAGRGTSRYPNGIKSWPEPIGNWILMKIIFLRHKISHLWWKIAIVWAILGHFWHVFADFFVSVTQLCSLWEPFQPGHSWPMWGHGLKPFQAHWAINPWLESVKNGSFTAKIDPNGRLIPGQGNPPGNCLVGHITSQSTGKHYLGPFKPSPGTHLV